MPDILVSPSIWSEISDSPAWLLKKAVLEILREYNQDWKLNVGQRKLGEDSETVSPALLDANGKVGAWAISLTDFADTQKSMAKQGMNQRLVTIQLTGYFDINDEEDGELPPSEVLLETTIFELMNSFGQKLVQAMGALGFSLHIVSFPSFSLDYVLLPAGGGLLLHRVRGGLTVDYWYSRTS